MKLTLKIERRGIHQPFAIERLPVPSKGNETLTPYPVDLNSLT